MTRILSNLSRNFASVSATALLIGLSASQALAQTARSVEDDDSASGEIIVTAQRTAENVQDVPISVAVISGGDLASRGLTDLRQISLAAPSLQLGHENNFVVRGVGTLSVQTTVDPAVAVSLDEVNLGRAQLFETIFNDVAQVEVLSGPQGLLFGKNASAGLLNVTTNKPKIGRTEGRVEAEFNLRDTTPGNGRGYSVKGMVNLPVSENSAFRLAGVISYQEPVARNFGSPARLDQNRKNYEIKAKYLYDPGEGLNLYLIGDYSKQTGTAGVFDRTWRSQDVGSLSLGPLAADGYVAGPNNLSFKSNDNQFRDLEAYSLQARVGYEFANGMELINIAAYADFKTNTGVDHDFMTAEGVREVSNTQYHQFSNELRLVLPKSDKLNGQFGIYYLKLREDHFHQVAGMFYFPAAVRVGFPFCVGATPVAGPPPACNVSNSFFFGLDTDYALTNESKAAFGQMTYELSPGIKLLAGARVTGDKLRMDILQNQGAYFLTLSGPPGQFSGRKNHTNFSYKLGIDVKPSDDILLYGNYSTGYKAPGTNDFSLVSGANIIVDAETSKNFELGAKTGWLDNKLIVNVAFFHTKYKNYQVQAFDVNVGGQALLNAARVTSKGAELTVQAKPVEGLSLSASATILDAKFNDFPGVQCYPGQVPCGADGTFNAQGLRTPLGAKFASTFDATYEFPIAGSTTMSLNANWYHRSPISFQPTPNPKTMIGTLDILGAAIGFNFNDRYSVTIFCKNCTDKRFPAYTYLQPLDVVFGQNSTIQAWSFNSVRNFGATISAKF